MQELLEFLQTITFSSVAWFAGIFMSIIVG